MLEEPLDRHDETVLLRASFVFRQVTAKVRERLTTQAKRVKDLVEMSFAPGEEGLGPDFEHVMPLPPAFGTP